MDVCDEENVEKVEKVKKVRMAVGAEECRWMGRG